MTALILPTPPLPQLPGSHPAWFWHPARSTPLQQCVLLAVLLHLWLALLLGSAPGGTASVGLGVAGRLNVRLDAQGNGGALSVSPAATWVDLPARATAPPQTSVVPAPMPNSTLPSPTVPNPTVPNPNGPTAKDSRAAQPRWGGAVRAADAPPPPDDGPGTARLGRWSAQAAADSAPLAATPLATSPLATAALPQAKQPMPGLARLPQPALAPTAAPAALPAALPAMPAVAAPVQVPVAPVLVPVPAARMPDAVAAPVPPPAPAVAAPVTPPVVTAPVTPPVLAPAVPPVAVPAAQTTTPPAPTPTPAPAPAPTPAPAPAATRTSPADAPAASTPLPAVNTTPGLPGLTGAPDAGSRVGRDVATPPAAPAGAANTAPNNPPPLNLNYVRPRGGELSRHSSTGLLPVLPRPPELPDKLANGVKKAGKADCKDAYAGAGLLAVVPLAVDTLRKDGGCKW